jgi:hypothetical protein
VRICGEISLPFNSLDQEGDPLRAHGSMMNVQMPVEMIKPGESAAFGYIGRPYARRPDD